MKKILCLILAMLMVAFCFAGCKTNDVDSSTTSSTVSTASSKFVAPDNYATVVLVSINPQFRLYLDADGIVLAVESVNNDAKAVTDKIDYKGTDYKDVIKDIVDAANDCGFIKENATIDIKITEAVDENVDADAVLDDMKKSVDDKLDQLEITAEITTSVVINKDEASSSAASSSPSSSSSAPTSSASSTSSAPACKHSKTEIKPISTGSNVIDSSKLDVVNHAKYCATCKKNLGLEKHTVKDGKCSACGQSNFATSMASLINAEVYDDNAYCAAKINDDGSLHYDLIFEESWFSAQGEWTDSHHKKISEAAMLESIRTKFVMSDSEFEKFKAKGVYNCSLETQTYSDGYFYFTDPAAGGPGNYTHELKGYKDNLKGTFTVYYDYLDGGPDVDRSERVHLYYYAVEYTYTGASNLTLSTDEYDVYCINGWKPVVNSLRVKSIKQVSNISGITTI